MNPNGLQKQVFQTEYRTGATNTPQELVKASLPNATRYRRASGYFSSSVLDVFQKEIFEFAKSGGVIELMCSPVMTSDDLEQISQGYEAKQKASARMISNIEEAINSGQSELQLSFLATLIHCSSLRLKIIFFTKGNGIFHDKSGYFLDHADQYVAFTGSANDSAFGFSGDGNFERLTVFTSWSRADADRCKETVQYVDDLWFGLVDGLDVFDFPEIAKDLLRKYTKEALSDFELAFHAEDEATPRRKKLMGHQKEALSNWKQANRRGILKHATGSGKTITAIAAIREHIDTGKPAIVLVPSKLLLEQWYEEIRQEIDDPLILRCGAGHVSWKRNQALSMALQNAVSGDPGSIVIAVNDSATSSDFLNAVTNHQNVLLVSDEVHALGSAKNSEIFEQDFAFRLGLSATPERFRDPEGTSNIFRYFNGIVEPEVTLFDALKAGRLVSYDYFPVLSKLNVEEEERWIEITNRIINYMRARDLDSVVQSNDKVLQTLLINRSRIAKKAEAKVDIVLNILSERYQDGQHWLVYCEDTAQLEEINQRLHEKHIEPYIYTSIMEGSAAEELRAFSMRGGILLSIRCLDEGVDIPKISHAIIAASSQNPRQFIQRRGRVLRKSEDKLNAVIFDCIVTPGGKAAHAKFDGLLLSEIKRSLEFATTARNAAAAEAVLRSILIKVGSDPDSIFDEAEGDQEDD